MLVAWIWALIFHMPLDLIKWMMAYILNEDGFRDRMRGKKPSNVALETEGADLPPQVGPCQCCRSCWQARCRADSGKRGGGWTCARLKG